MTLTEIFAILFIHWIADFVFQDEKWALGKSNNSLDLILHTATYSTIWFIAGYLIALTLETSDQRAVYMLKSVMFFCVTIFFHTIQDYITSRIVARRYAIKYLGGPIPNLGAFTIIGIDQFLHYVQLFLTYYYIKEYLI